MTGLVTFPHTYSSLKALAESGARSSGRDTTTEYLRKHTAVFCVVPGESIDNVSMKVLLYIDPVLQGNCENNVVLNHDLVQILVSRPCDGEIFS